MDTPNRGRGRPPGDAPYPRGSSPFSSPLAGDVLHATRTGEMREVVSRGGGFVEFYRDKEDKPRTVTSASWREWCSKHGAELVDSRAKR